MSGRSEKVKAGVFVLVSAAMLVAVVVLIVGFRLSDRTKTFYVRFKESVSGLEEGSTVRYYGVPVGRVVDIGFSKVAFPQIRVAIEVEPDTPIRTDTIAVLKPQGITGFYYIDLEEGSVDSRRLREGEMIPAKASVTAQLMETLVEIREVVANLNAILAENREGVNSAVSAIEAAAREAQGPIRRLDEMLSQASGLAEELRGHFDRSFAKAERTLDAMAEMAGSPEMRELPAKVTAVLDRADEFFAKAGHAVEQADVERVAVALESAISQLEKTAATVEEAIGQIRTGLAENRGTMLRILDDVRSFSANLKLLARMVREDPSRILFGRPPREREEGR